MYCIQKYINHLNNLELKMSICMKKFHFTIIIIKTGFVTNAKWREQPGFGMLHHIYL